MKHQINNPYIILDTSMHGHVFEFYFIIADSFYDELSFPCLQKGRAENPYDILLLYG